MRLLLDHGARVVAAVVAGDLLGAGDHPHGGRTGEERQGATDVRVGNRVAVAVEPHVRRLAGHDGAHHVRLEGMRGEWQQPRLLLGEHVGHGPIALLGMRTAMRDVVAPPPKLRVQIRDIDKRARGKEGVAQVLDLALDFPFGESRQMPLMARLRSESSGSPIHSTH